MPRVEWHITLYESVISEFESIKDKAEQDKMAIAIMRWLSGDDDENLVKFFSATLKGRRILKDLRRAVSYSKKKATAELKRNGDAFTGNIQEIKKPD